jgi:hypothetical protein
MPIVADVEDLAIAEFLLVLSLTSKTGKLSVRHGENKVLLALREGAIVYAASPAVRERLGSVLVNRGLVTEGELNTALKVQRELTTPSLLGNILVEMGALDQDALRDAIKSQFENVISELLTWDGGVMVFERIEIPDLGEIHVDPAEVLVGIGVETDNLVVQSLSRLEMDRSSDRPEQPETPFVPPIMTAVTDEELPEESAETAPEPVPTVEDMGGEVMRSLLEEMESISVSLTAEMTLAIMGSASEVAERALLFLVQPDSLSGIGGFGPGRDGNQITGRGVRLPHHRESIFAQVIGSGSPHVGPVEETEGNRTLLDELGGTPASEAMVVPMSFQDRVVAVLYADSGAEAGALGPLNVVTATMEHVAEMLGQEGGGPGAEWRFKVQREEEQVAAGE